MSILQSAVLGFIQGFGEFLPVSSSGHLLLARFFLGTHTDSPAMKMLDILLHLGTLLPVIIVFRKEWVEMILHPFRNKTLLLLLIASLPTLALYITAKKLLPDENGFAVFDSGWFLGPSFIVSALFLLICDSLSVYHKRRNGCRVGIFQALLMGLFQGIGMIPGISRSGSTILAGVSAGLNKSTAAKFSFMMSAPAIVGSVILEGKDAFVLGYINEIALVPSLVGMIISAVIGYIAIRFMLRMIVRIPLAWFALYLSATGIIFMLLQLSGNSLVPVFSIPFFAAVG